MEKITFENGMYHIIPAEKLRETPNVIFHNVPIINPLSAIDFVDHASNAISPSIPDYEGKPWYMHPYQEDNLLVIQGKRHVSLFLNKEIGVQEFEVTSSYVKRLNDGKILFEGMSLFGWSEFVFHRIQSGSDGSKSINYAKHKENFDIKYNFNIYSLNTETGENNVIREGHKDQPTK